MKRTARSTASATPRIADLCCDVSMDDIHMTLMAIEDSPFPQVFKPIEPSRSSTR